MATQTNKFNKKVSALEEMMITNTDRPEFYGLKIFYSKEEHDAFHKAYRDRNKGKFFRPGEVSFVGMSIIHGEDMRPQKSERQEGE